MSQGRIHVILSPEIVSAALDLVSLIEAQLPFLQILQPLEKIRLVKPRLGAQEVFQGIADLQRDAGIPPGPDDPMLADFSVYAGLTQISDRLSTLAQRINDTCLLAGSEGWNQALIRYGMLRQLQRSNPALKSRLDRLQRLIARGAGRATPDEDEPETTEPIDPAE